MVPHDVVTLNVTHKSSVLYHIYIRVYTIYTIMFDVFDCFAFLHTCINTINLRMTIRRMCMSIQTGFGGYINISQSPLLLIMQYP